MAQSLTLIVTQGDLPGLVATAMALDAAQASAVHLLHLRDFRENAVKRFDFAQQQFAFFKTQHFLDLQLPKFLPRPQAQNPTLEPLPALYQSQILLTALARAVDMGAKRLVWPVSCQQHVDQTAQISELVELVLSLAQLENESSPGDLPEIQLPLVELSDQQIILIGQKLHVPWQLSWSCQMAGQKPCGVCHGCRSRAEAFKAAGAVDPMDKPQR